MSTSTATAPSSNNPRMTAKSEEIRRILTEPTVDLWSLREMALTEGGLVSGASGQSTPICSLVLRRVVLPLKTCTFALYCRLPAQTGVAEAGWRRLPSPKRGGCVRRHQLRRPRADRPRRLPRYVAPAHRQPAPAQFSDEEQAPQPAHHATAEEEAAQVG